MRTKRHRLSLRITLPVMALAIGGLTLGATGVANADSGTPIRVTNPTVTMPISSDIDMAGVIARLSDPTGQWAAGPAEYIAPSASEFVAAAAHPKPPHKAPKHEGYGHERYGQERYGHEGY
ncbi:hypothetical protein [Rhodococcus marinonascens]|uniref:hypothetical protein n=1 Tax=Rhodococcus marinonascens TaxID=38311 RepID=UPI00093295DD|nr:hypothetical protein [Rhodococcus marinonascens]